MRVAMHLCAHRRLLRQRVRTEALEDPPLARAVLKCKGRASPKFEWLPSLSLNGVWCSASSPALTSARFSEELTLTQKECDAAPSSEKSAMRAHELAPRWVLWNHENQASAFPLLALQTPQCKPESRHRKNRTTDYTPLVQVARHLKHHRRYRNRSSHHFSYPDTTAPTIRWECK